MAQVKILLEPGETELDADSSLQKALDFHSSGDAHLDDAFNDPAMAHLMKRLDSEHSQMYSDMIQEILEVLDQEYSDGD